MQDAWVFLLWNIYLISVQPMQNQSKSCIFSLIHIKWSWFSLYCHFFFIIHWVKKNWLQLTWEDPVYSNLALSQVRQYIFIWYFSILQSSLFVHANKCEHYFLLLVDMNESYLQCHNMCLYVEYRILFNYLSFTFFPLTILIYYFQLNLHQLFWLATILLLLWNINEFI